METAKMPSFMVLYAFAMQLHTIQANRAKSIFSLSKHNANLFTRKKITVIVC